MAKTCKYQKLQRYVSYDNGATWQAMEEYQRGALIEADSPDCGATPILYRWTEMPSGSSYVCVGYDKYTEEKKQQSTDGGTTWTDVSPLETRSGSTVIEYNSEDCGYVPPQPTGNTKWITYYSGGTYLTGECDSTSAITSQNCPPNYNGNNPCIELIVGDCVTTIRIQSWSQGQFMYVSSVTLSNSVTTLDVGAFEHFSGLTSIVIPDSVMTIGDSAFYLCTSLSSVTIGSGVTSIGNASFNRCNLDEIVIPNNVVTIGEQAFCNSGIKSATIGSGVTSIGGDAFSQNPNLSSITITALVPPTLESYGVFDYTNDCLIYVPCDSLSAYQSEWSIYASRIVGIPPCSEIQFRWYPSGTTCISYDKYQNNIKQQSTDGGQTWENVNPEEYSASTLIEANSEDCGYVPPTPTGNTKWVAIYGSGNISSGACSSYSGISGVNGQIIRKNISYLVIGDCVTYIENSGFAGYHSLSSLTIGQNIETIGRQAFAGCSGLTSVIIPNSVITIGGYAFAECINLTAITFGNSVTTIGDQTFRRCSGLTIVVLPNTIETIDAWGFADCSGLTSITMSSGLTTIGEGAFYNDNSLSSIIIPSSVTTIGGRAFMNCSGLTSIIIYATTPPTFGDSGVFNNTNNCTIYVPAASLTDYQNAWSDYASRIQPIPNS